MELELQLNLDNSNLFRFPLKARVIRIQLYLIILMTVLQGFVFTFLLCCPIAIDKCKEGLHDCHVNATCEKAEDSYSCTCKPGLQGDGKNSCEGEFNKIFIKQPPSL